MWNTVHYILYLWLFNVVYKWSPNIVRVIKSIRLRWAVDVARMEEGRSAFKILTGKPTGKRPLGRKIWEWTLKKYMSIRRIGLIRLRIGFNGEALWMRHWTSGFMQLAYKWSSPREIILFIIMHQFPHVSTQAANSFTYKIQCRCLTWCFLFRTQ